MKNLLYLILVISSMAFLCGCIPDKMPGEVISDNDQYYYDAGATYVIWIEGHKKYLWIDGYRGGLTDADDCPCKEEMLNRLLDSIREIVKEEIRVRLYLATQGDSVESDINLKVTKK